jgi:hypothetical protein
MVQHVGHLGQPARHADRLDAVVGLLNLEDARHVQLSFLLAALQLGLDTGSAPTRRPNQAAPGALRNPGPRVTVPQSTRDDRVIFRDY